MALLKLAACGKLALLEPVDDLGSVTALHPNKDQIAERLVPSVVAES